MTYKQDYNKKLADYLTGFVLDERKNRMFEVISQRTRYLTVVLEDLFQEHNASAVLRTCDILGVQDIHIIENAYKYHINKDIALGSSKWLNFYDHNMFENNTITAINHLRDKGYRIVATTPHTNDINLEDFDIEKGKFALFFGSEVPGLTKLVLDNADEFLKIPMFGFTESFNISVSAGVIMNQLMYKIRKSKLDWQLSDNEKNIILIEWLKSTIKSSDLIIKEFNKKQGI
jgi:tRNA (guanosine-2'-O-)-methyltransferase